MRETENRMLMWYVILVIVVILTVCGLVYLGSRVACFGRRDGKDSGAHRRNRIVGFSIVLLVFVVLSLLMNLMNAIVCLLHFVVLWLLSDLTFSLMQRIRKRPFAHYYAGWTAILFSVISLAAGWYLDHQVWATSYVIESDKVGNRLRLIVFADSHIGTTFDSSGFARHLRRMQAYQPDAVLIAGDFVDDGTSRDEMTASCRALGQLETKYGVYFAMGNHDKGYHDPAARGFTGDDLVAELQKNKVRVLQDETVLVGNRFYVAGRKDVSEILRGGFRVETAELFRGLDTEKFVAVVDHQPNDYEKQAAAKADLVVSGHTHGGQLFPLNKVGEWIGANDKTYGHERRNVTDFIVTSGLSDWAIKFKTGTKSEFVVIDIVPRGASES